MNSVLFTDPVAMGGGIPLNSDKVQSMYAADTRQHIASAPPLLLKSYFLPGIARKVATNLLTSCYNTSLRPLGCCGVKLSLCFPELISGNL